MIVSFGETLRCLRKDKKLSQRALARKIGISVSMIGLYENNERMPSYNTLIKISYVFGVTTDFLLGIETRDQTMIDVSGLTEPQVQAVFSVVEQFKDKG